MNSTIEVVARRAAVTVGVVGSLGLGAATIDAAAQWTAAAAPMQAPAVSAESLASQLANEQARGTDLQSRLQAATTQAAEVQAALDAANARIPTDDGTAKALRAQITAAEKKLVALNKQAATAAAAMKSAAARQAAAARQTAVISTARPTATHATMGASGAPASGVGGDD
jgi:chromosome segregation ATPase